MKVEIFHNPTNNTYEWKLCDGPDGIDYFEGVELDLGQCFEQIIIKRTQIALEYK